MKNYYSFPYNVDDIKANLLKRINSGEFADMLDTVPNGPKISFLFDAHPLSETELDSALQKLKLHFRVGTLLKINPGETTPVCYPESIVIPITNESDFVFYTADIANVKSTAINKTYYVKDVEIGTLTLPVDFYDLSDCTETERLKLDKPIIIPNSKYPLPSSNPLAISTTTPDTYVFLVTFQTPEEDYSSELDQYKV